MQKGFWSQQTPDHTQQTLIKTRSFVSANCGTQGEIAKYETHLRVEDFLRRSIIKSLDHKWLAKVESETMGFNHLSAKDLRLTVTTSAEASTTWT